MSLPKRHPFRTTKPVRFRCLDASVAKARTGDPRAVGCSQRCHTNRCPVGVTTQSPKLQRGLIVEDKAERVHNPRFQAWWDEASAESFRPWSASERAHVG
jgi:glutamate synthase-like protein